MFSSFSDICVFWKYFWVPDCHWLEIFRGNSLNDSLLLQSKNVINKRETQIPLALRDGEFCSICSFYLGKLREITQKFAYKFKYFRLNTNKLDSRINVVVAPTQFGIKFIPVLRLIMIKHFNLYKFALLQSIFSNYSQ